MIQSQSLAITKLLVPLSVTMALPVFDLDTGDSICPAQFHDIPRSEFSEDCWRSFDSLSSRPVQEDHVRYRAVTGFASRLLRETSDMPADFAKVIDDEFWNLV